MTGGIKMRVKKNTAKEWCDYYGVEVKNGIAVLYKAVNEGYSSNHDPSFKWVPGTKPEVSYFCKKTECEKGLHFSPHPTMTHQFIDNPAHYLACPVKVSDIVIHPNGAYPEKCKAQRVCAPIWEVNEYGEKI